MADEEDLVATELEALDVTYGESLTVLARQPLHIRLHVTPFTGDDEARQYVCADLELIVAPAYPDALPEVQLRRCKGLSDARQAQLLARLQEEAAGLAGSMMLGHLCETARDALTALNSPEGDCIFCRCPLLGDEEEDNGPSTSDSGEDELLKLPCYHVYHYACFARWWRWEQRSLNRQRKQVMQELGAQAGNKLHPMGLVPDASGLFTVLCPSCRSKMAPPDLAHVLPRLCPKRGSPEAVVLEAAEQQEAAQAGEAEAKVSLAAVDMEQLRRMQARHARLFEGQRQRGCLVDESWGVSLGPQPGTARAAVEESGAGMEAGQGRAIPQRQERAGNGKGRDSDRRGGRRKHDGGKDVAR